MSWFPSTRHEPQRVIKVRLQERPFVSFSANMLTDIIGEVKASGMETMACNHCTGWMWAEMAATHGVPIVKETSTYETYAKKSTRAPTMHI